MEPRLKVRRRTATEDVVHERDNFEGVQAESSSKID